MRYRFFSISLSSLIFAIFGTGCIVTPMLYPAPPRVVPSPPPIPFEEVRLTSGGKQIVCWHLSRDDVPETAPAILWFHGNGENLETMRESGLFDRISRLGVHLLAMDYPSYGLSEGKPSQKSLVNAGREACRWLQIKYPNSLRIVCGSSLGAAVAIQIAKLDEKKLDGLITMSGWDKLENVAARFYPRPIVRIFLRDKFLSQDTIAQIELPALIMHGVLDELIPIEQGQNLANSAANLYRWVPLEGSEHSTVSANPLTWDSLKSFLEYVANKKGRRVLR